MIEETEGTARTTLEIGTRALVTARQVKVRTIMFLAVDWQSAIVGGGAVSTVRRP